jgi:hypothetical protein
MLTSGTDRATPNQTMWPLFCNEVGLSYEQEERVRAYQRTLLATRESWLHRHAAFAAGKTMQTLHDAVQALTTRVGQREKSDSLAWLSEPQRMKLATWSARHRDQLAQLVVANTPTTATPTYRVSPALHAAANLYALNYQLQMVVNAAGGPAVPIVVGGTLKKLSRRPLFESLGGGNKGEGEEGMSRNGSFASTGSLKRSMNEMSVVDDDDGDENMDRPHDSAVSPQEAEAAAAPLVEETLGHLREIIPASPVVSMVVSIGQTRLAIPSPTPVSSMAAAVQPDLTLSFPTEIITMPDGYTSNGEPETKHVRRSSFLPPHLNVVPEEMLWLTDPSTEDFLMNLVDGDWAIGEEL